MKNYLKIAVASVALVSITGAGMWVNYRQAHPVAPHVVRVSDGTVREVYEACNTRFTSELSPDGSPVFRGHNSTAHHFVALSDGAVFISGIEQYDGETYAVSCVWHKGVGVVDWSLDYPFMAYDLVPVG